MALRKAETLVVKQFLIAFVIHAGVWSSRDKFLGDGKRTRGSLLPGRSGTTL
uniref:N-(5'-phosphoribosyl)anthranilate isomerase n=1 Tax=Nostoc flagelliforme str. Sunitezuoqi TaxID=676037 RepID=E7DQ61_9NOSO|nr:N-(5'-phosphoribosyl)anthranilate isomerase [Nostoc flagelliforme str. Sunitezuoqi]